MLCFVTSVGMFGTPTALFEVLLSQDSGSLLGSLSSYVWNGIKESLQADFFLD